MGFFRIGEFLGHFDRKLKMINEEEAASRSYRDREDRELPKERELRF